MTCYRYLRKPYCMTCPKTEIPNQAAVPEINHHVIDDDAGRTGRPASELLP